jgi:hypothetical protein
VDYLYFGEVFPNVRVRATWEDWLNPDAYEAYTCLVTDALDGEDPLLRDELGNVRYEWRRAAKPVNGAAEKRLIDRKLLAIDQARFLPRDIQTNEPVIMHRGGVRWNAYRNCWIMIATQVGGTSHLGEVWYAEAPQPTGPWRRTVKIVTHDQYSFYNPVHHAFFDQDGGRLIYFEGTYTQTFSGNSTATPRYDYNQIMYRLDLSQRRLTGVLRQ